MHINVQVLRSPVGFVYRFVVQQSYRLGGKHYKKSLLYLGSIRVDELNLIDSVTGVRVVDAKLERMIQLIQKMNSIPDTEKIKLIESVTSRVANIGTIRET